MKRVLAAAAIAASVFATPALADDYPSRPIRVFTTSSAGGISDIFMRVLNDAMQSRLGQPLIVENKPGGAGTIAARACQDAPPDGYTICIINADTMIYNQFLYKKIPFDPEKLVPIVNLFHLIQVLVVNSDLGAKTVDDLVAVSKAKPGTLNYLTASIPCVVYMDNLKKNKGADWVRVPFRGGGEAVTAILSGTTPIVNLFHLIQVLVVNSSLNVKTVDDLVAASKAKPATLNYLTASVPLVVYMDRLHKEKGADWVRVPFRGGGEAVTAILGGTTPIGLIGLGNVISHIKAGKMNALVLVNNIRTPLLPDVPTLADLGYKGAASETWYGLFAPAGTPKPIVDKIASEVTRVFSDKDFVEKYVISRGQVPAINTPEQFAAEIKAERAAAAGVVKEAGMEQQ